MNKTSFTTGLSLVLGGMACASDFTWSFPDAAVAPKAEICTFLYGKTWAYSFEMDDNPAGAFTIAKPLFDACTATDAPPGVPGGHLRHLPGTLAIIACALDNGNGTNISLEQLKTVLADGWSIANHGYWSTGIHWDKALANDAWMYHREFFWGQFFISRYLWEGKRACTGMVFPNGDPGYIPFLEEYGFLLGTRYADSPHNVLADGTTRKVNWLDCGRLMLDTGHWQSLGQLDPLWLLPKEVREGDWLIDFTHGISEEGKGNHEAAAKRLEYIRKTWGSDGADNVWFAPSDRVAEYRKAAEAATVAVTRNTVTVSLPDKVYAAPLTLKILGIDPKAELRAPEGGLVYRDADGAVYLTTPVLGTRVNPHPAGNLSLVYDADLKVATREAPGEAQEISFDKPVKLAAVRLRQMGGLPEGFRLDLRFVTPDGKEVPFNDSKYAKWIKLGDAWGNWRLFPLLPDEEPLPVVAVRFNAVPAFNRVEVWAVE